MAGPDRIEESRRYVFGEDERSYGIWEKGGGEEPLERFPVTDEGFDQGFTRFLELRAMERRFRGQLPKLLVAAVLLGAALWLVGGVVEAAFVAGVTEGRSDIALIYELSFVADALGYRMAIGGLFLLAALALLRWERRTRRSEDAAADRLLPLGGVSEDPTDAWTRSLRWALLLGMGVWVLSAFATKWLFPFREGFVQVGAPDTGFRIAHAVEFLAFRVWVVALVLLLLRWGRAWLRRREGSPASPERPPT